MTTTTDDENKPYEILLDKEGHVEERLQQIAARARRKKLPPLEWRWGKTFRRKEKVDGGGTKLVERRELFLLTPTPRYAGWTFVAVLQHLDGTNIVRAASDVQVPTQYWTRGPVCDHCKLARQRVDTYVVQHDDGRFLQVGKTCLKDFLGSQEAERVAAFATFIAEARDAAEDGEDEEASPGQIEAAIRRSRVSLERFLEYAAFDVRDRGYVSNKKAEESFDPILSTSDTAWMAVTDQEFAAKYHIEPNDADKRHAALAAQWAEDLTDEEVMASDGTYLHNIRSIAQSGGVEGRTAGLAASIVVAYARAMERKRAAAAPAAEAKKHLGAVGEKIRVTATLESVFSTDTKFGTTTKLTFRTTEGDKVVWWASSTDLAQVDVGRTFVVSGAVKSHGEWKGVPETIITRARVDEPGEEKLTAKAKKAKAADTRMSDVARLNAIEHEMLGLADEQWQLVQQPPETPWTPEQIADFSVAEAAGWVTDARRAVERLAAFDAAKALANIKTASPRVAAWVNEAVAIVQRAKGPAQPVTVPTALPEEYADISAAAEAYLVALNNEHAKRIDDLERVIARREEHLPKALDTVAKAQAAGDQDRAEAWSEVVAMYKSAPKELREAHESARRELPDARVRMLRALAAAQAHDFRAAMSAAERAPTAYGSPSYKAHLELWALLRQAKDAHEPRSTTRRGRW